ncbi:MAG: class I SAM-dependent methyltransferase [bacterium]
MNLYKNRPYLSLWRSCEAFSILTSIRNFNLYKKLDAKDIIRMDIGCGNGRTANGLGIRFTIGLDTYYELVREARDSKQYKSVIVGDATNLPIKRERINFIISNCVFEHIEDIKSAINETYRVLIEGGVFVLTMPLKNLISDILFFMPLSLFGLNNIVEFLINRGLKHYHYFEKDVYRMIREKRFKIISLSYYMPSRLVSWWLFLRYSERLFYRLNVIGIWKIISRIIERINGSLIRSSLKYKRIGGGITIVSIKE